MDNQTPIASEIDNEARLGVAASTIVDNAFASSARDSSENTNRRSNDDGGDGNNKQPRLVTTPLLAPEEAEDVVTEIEAMNAPWLGSEESNGQVWWRRPSVRPQSFRSLLISKSNTVF